MSPPSYSGSAWCCPALTLLCCRRSPMGAGLSQTQDGAVLASQHAAQPATMAEVVRERKRKMNGGLATLRRRLLAGRRGGRGSRNSRSTDRAAPLRDLLKEWSPLEVGALLEEYEALAALRDLCVQAELARPPAAALRGDLATLYDHKICPDAELIFKGACFPVHRAILSARCPYFRDLLNGYPSLGARVCLEAPLPPAVDAACLDGLLRYLYAGEAAPSPCPACDGDSYDTSNRRQPSSSVPDCCPAQADSNRSQHGIGGRLALDVVGSVVNKPCTRRPDPSLLRRLASDLGATPSALHRDMRHLLDTAELADASLVFPGESYSSWPASHTNTTNSNSSSNNNDLRSQHPSSSSASNQQPYSAQSTYGGGNNGRGSSNISNGASPPSEEYGFRPRLELPCHRAVLGARSPFFRSVIQRRCRQQSTGGAQSTPNPDAVAASSTQTNQQHASANTNGTACVKIVLDEKVIPHKYARVLLHAVYTDQVDLNLIMRGGSSIFSCSLLANHGSSLGEAQVLSGSRDQTANGNRSGGGGGSNSGGSNVAVAHAPSPLEEAMELYEIGRFLELDILSQGCEDIIAERLSANSLAAVLKWSSQPHGSKWVHRQALRFLREEFQSVASGPALPQLEANHLAHALRCPFLQASELDALRAVIRWGEHRLVKRMEDREPNLLSHTAHSVTRKGVKKRDLSDLELRELLADILPLVRIDHILPPNNELLGQAIRRGLLSSPPSCMLGDEGGSHSSTSRADAWIRGKGHGGLYVRPRLFMPYYEEVKALLEDQLVQETELVRMRRARYIPDIPDTLYMVSAEPRARSSASSSNGIPQHVHHPLDCSPTIDLDKSDPNNLLMMMGHHAHNPMGQMASSMGQAGEDGGGGGTEAALPPPGQQVVRAMLARERELRRAPACVRANGLPLSHTAEINRQIRLRVVREFNLPDSVADTLESAAALEAGNRSSSSACGDDDDDEDDTMHRRNNDQDRRGMMAPVDNSEPNQSRSCMDGENSQRDVNGSHRRIMHGSGDAIDSWCSGSPAGGRRPLPALLTEGDVNGQRSAESSAPRSRNRRQPHPGRGLSEAMPDVAMATNSLGRLRLGRDHVTVHGSTSGTSKNHYPSSNTDNQTQKNIYSSSEPHKNIYGTSEPQKNLYGTNEPQKNVYGTQEAIKNIYGINCEQQQTQKNTYASAEHVKMVYGTTSDHTKHVYDQSKNLYGTNNDHSSKNPYSHQLYATCSRDGEFENVQCEENARLNDASRNNLPTAGFNANSREICTFAMLGRDADKMYGSREMLCAVDRAHRPVIQKDGSCNSYSLTRDDTRQPPLSQREVCSSYSLNRDDHSFTGYREHHQYNRDINPYCLNKETLNQAQYCTLRDDRIAPVHQNPAQYCAAKDERNYDHNAHHPRQFCLPQKEERPSSYSLSRDVNSIMQRENAPYCLNKDERSAYSLNRDTSSYCLNKDDRLRHSAFMNPNQHLLQEGCTLGGVRSNPRGDIRERRGARYAADVVTFQRTEAEAAQPLQLDLGDGNQHSSPGRQSSGSQSPWNRSSETRNSDRNPSSRHSVQSDYAQQGAPPSQNQQKQSQNMTAAVYQSSSSMAVPSSPSRGTYSRYISANQNSASSSAQATVSAVSGQGQHNTLQPSASFNNPVSNVSSTTASPGSQMNQRPSGIAVTSQQSSSGAANTNLQQQSRQPRLNRLGQELAPPIAFASNGFSTLQHHGRSRSPRVAQPGHATLQRPRPIVPNNNICTTVQSSHNIQNHPNVQSIPSSSYACESLNGPCYGTNGSIGSGQRSSGVGEEDGSILGLSAVTTAVHRSHSAGSMASIHGEGGKNNVQNVSGYNYAPAVVSSSYPSAHQTSQQHQYHESTQHTNTSPRHFRSISSLSHEPFPYHTEAASRINVTPPVLNFSNSSMENIIAENNRIVFTRAASYRSSPYQELPYSRVESPFSCVQRGDSPFQSRGGSPFRALDGTPTSQFSRGNSPYMSSTQGMQTRAQSPKSSVLNYSRNVTNSPSNLKVMSSSSRSQGGSPLSSFSSNNKQRNFTGLEKSKKDSSRNNAQQKSCNSNKSQNRNSAIVETEQVTNNARNTPSPSTVLNYSAQNKSTPVRSDCLSVEPASNSNRTSPSNSQAFNNGQTKPINNKRGQHMETFEPANRASPKDDKSIRPSGRDGKPPGGQNLRLSASQYHVGSTPRYL